MRVSSSINDDEQTFDGDEVFRGDGVPLEKSVLLFPVFEQPWLLRLIDVELPGGVDGPVPRKQFA